MIGTRLPKVRANWALLQGRSGFSKLPAAGQFVAGGNAPSSTGSHIVLMLPMVWAFQQFRYAED